MSKGSEREVMTNEQQLKLWLLEDESRMSALLLAGVCAQHFGIKDWCIAAGFVRNLVWNKLHECLTPTALTDIDFIYFDGENISKQREKEIEAWLQQREAHISHASGWSVKNQARMHSRNGDSTYTSCLNAMAYWPEKETAVGVQLDSAYIKSFTTPSSNNSEMLTQSELGKFERCWADRLQVHAAFGLDSLFSLHLTPNPKRSLDSFLERVAQKAWLTHFPKLRLNI